MSAVLPESSPVMAGSSQRKLSLLFFAHNVDKQQQQRYPTAAEQQRQPDARARRQEQDET
ncbi:hypothetical protein [Corynebacterium propinquum]|uniref:hypothetical protein n=1 Tax=Corynebacterium propinquum TaxID=43769 RepID=UPI00253FD220|nr:hypothetical protein [Corynebacterium propinquum]MDK4257318.1 hypothetical protein [Corynebacterium propinquum]MDK4282718.1 hypothetical protein [Corynebacterium propinquum]MDK4299624.1 hypothetical protein [Corynebacterium propinquum]WKS32598.1 hypothetical protein NLL45_03140 [Corynebacterium propinquum]WKS36654.1 hypothetical protein NLL30_01560 [Corynebacterium propinquum]